jgi:hypothetical protein
LRGCSACSYDASPNSGFGDPLLARHVIALIVDDLRVTQWQAEALAQLNGDVSFVLLNCTNTRFTRRPFRHGLYYLLNLLCLKTAITRPVPLPSSLDIIDRLDFESDWEGAWQRLPAQSLDMIAKRRPALAIKFGMGLLRVPEELTCPILSYHHGDPRSYRGRPAGFYELLGGDPLVGQIVQTISNRLDAGSVVAFAQTPVRPHSYRATMAESFSMSPRIFRAAVRNALSGTVLPVAPHGKNYRLPSNATVVRFTAKIAAAKLKRLLYGGFVEKEWSVAQASLPVGSPEDLLNEMPPRSQWRVVERPPEYRFLADPFPHPSGGILAEALRRSDGQGEIVHIYEERTHVLCSGTGHFSYPATIATNNGSFLVPEVSEWSRPLVYRMDASGAQPEGELDIDGDPRIVDPTLHSHDGRLYLFGNGLADGPGVLRLWVADDLRSRFSEHPESPIRISPEGSRMAGAPLRLGGRLLRLGQDCSRDYGDGIIVFEIDCLSPDSYSERQLGTIRFGDLKGPHTLNFKDGTAVFDFYRERFSPFAGVRRLQAALSKRKASSSRL